MSLAHVPSSSDATYIPPPPPQTGEFGWGSQQEANKTKMKKTKTTTYQDDDEWEENLPLCQLLEPKTRPPSWKWRKTFSKLVVPEIELDWLQNMRLLATPPPPPQTAEFGWSSQQEQNKASMKETKKERKWRLLTQKKNKKEYNFDDLVKSNILSFIQRPPLVKIVAKKWWNASTLEIMLRDVTRHIDTRKTKKALGIKGAGKLKVFVEYGDKEDFDEGAQTQVVYKYDVYALPSHPLGVFTERGYMAKCPQGKVYVVFK